MFPQSNESNTKSQIFKTDNFPGSISFMYGFCMKVFMLNKCRSCRNIIQAFCKHCCKCLSV